MNLKSMFMENDKFSITRIGFGFVLTVTILGWITFCFVESNFVDIPTNVVYLNMALGFSKVAQKFGEKKL